MRVAELLKRLLFFACAMTYPCLARDWDASKDINCLDNISIREGISTGTFIKGSFRGSEFGCQVIYAEEPCGPFKTTSASDNRRQPSINVQARNGEMVTFTGEYNPNEKVVRAYCNPDENGADCWKVWSSDHTLTNPYTVDVIRLNIEYKQNIKCNNIAF